MNGGFYNSEFHMECDSEADVIEMKDLGSGEVVTIRVTVTEGTE